MGYSSSLPKPFGMIIPLLLVIMIPLMIPYSNANAEGAQGGRAASQEAEEKLQWSVKSWKYIWHDVVGDASFPGYLEKLEENVAVVAAKKMAEKIVTENFGKINAIQYFRLGCTLRKIYVSVASRFPVCKDGLLSTTCLGHFLVEVTNVISDYSNGSDVQSCGTSSTDSHHSQFKTDEIERLRKKIEEMEKEIEMGKAEREKEKMDLEQEMVDRKRMTKELEDHRKKLEIIFAWFSNNP